MSEPAQTRPASADPPSFSRAFETFVVPEPEQRDDVVGLLAYALYKRAVREGHLGGHPPIPSAQRIPIPTQVEAYRGAAERLIQGLAKAAVEEATPEIMQGGFVVAVENSKAELEQVIRGRTRFWSSVLTNLLAWVITLAVTVVIVTAFYLPNWQSDLVERLRAATSGAVTAPPLTPPRSADQ